MLVRDDFRGKGFVNAIIDLPFALPTIVASIVLLSLYGPRSPIGLHLYATQPALIIALAFVTLPFVVRSVQPVLMEVDREAEEAAASLGASGWTTFRRIILPALYPALLGGAGLAFARAVGEFGSVVLIGGGIPRETEVASQYIAKQIEIDRPASAAAVSVALLLISLRRALRHPARHQEQGAMKTRIALRTAALAYLGALVLVPLAMILFRTFEDGFVAFWEPVTTPAAISAISLSLTIVAIVVPLNVVFGLVTALALARGQLPRQGPAAGRRRPAVRGLAGDRRRRADPLLGQRRLARRRAAGDLLAARDGAGDDLRHAAVRRARGRAGAARDRHRAGGGRGDARRRRSGRRSGGSRCPRSGSASPTASCSPSPARSASSAR